MTGKQALRDFLTVQAKKETAIGDDDSLLVSKLLDSLRVVELVVFLEKEYHVTFDAEELHPDNLDTINSIVRLLERKGVE
jgi:acyl carrier protein